MFASKYQPEGASLLAAHQVFTFDNPTDVYVSSNGGRLNLVLKCGKDCTELDINLQELFFMEDSDGLSSPGTQEPAGTGTRH